MIVPCGRRFLPVLGSSIRPVILWTVFSALLFGISPSVRAQFERIETEHLRLLYLPEDAYVVPHLARCFENSMSFHRRLFGYTPSEKVTILLHDFSDYGSGGATSMPWNLVSIGIEPFDYVYETQPTNERMNWLMNHELMHIAAYDKANGADNFFRTIFFGKVAPTAENPISMLFSYLTIPRRYVPRWYHEGIAVFMETWMAGGFGRVLGGYDEMVFRTMVRDSTYFYEFVGLESEGTAIDFQIGQNSYLYGTRFMSYLALRYGPEKLLEWINRTPGSRRYYTSQFDHVYGRSLDEEWSRWISWEREWQLANLDSIALHPVTTYRPILRDALGSVSRAYYDSSSGKLFTAINYPGVIAHITAIDVRTGTMEKICEIPTPALYYVASITCDISAGKIFYTTDNTHAWRDLNVVDIGTGKSEMLMKDARIGDLAFNPADKSLWGVRHDGGISTLVTVPPPYTRWVPVLKLPYGRDMFDLDCSPDGRLLSASAIEISGRQRLLVLSMEKLLAGDATPENEYEFENNAPQNFMFSPDGKYLYGTSYYTGVSNVFRYDLQQKSIEAVTNAETGFFRPAHYTADSLFVFRYTGRGFLPCIIPSSPIKDVSAIRYLGQAIVEQHPVVREWMVGSPAEINLDSLTIARGTYEPLHHIGLSSIYPVVEGYKHTIGAGLRFNLMDPVFFNDLSASVLYSTNRALDDDERIHAALNYRYLQWRFAATYNRSDFYDLFGPTKSSRKGYSLSVTYGGFLLDERPKVMDYAVTLSGYGGLQRLPDAQNVGASFDKFMVLGARLNYMNYGFSLGAVDNERGIRAQLVSRTNYVNRDVSPLVNGNIDLGFMLPLDHSSIWLRNSAGHSFGNKNSTFSYFYFGGFGNNWVDYGGVKRYRESYSFPGVGLNAIGGLNYLRSMVEWTMPPLRFRRFGFPAIYVNWARAALFASGIVTDLDDAAVRRTVYNAGGQVDFKLVLFSNLDATLSFGYAFAFEKEEIPSREFMVSLKIL